jgi:hypothetical protein
MTRASGSTTPRWTLTMVVVVVKASMIALNSSFSLRVHDSAAEDEPTRAGLNDLSAPNRARSPYLDSTLSER